MSRPCSDCYNDDHCCRQTNGCVSCGDGIAKTDFQRIDDLNKRIHQSMYNICDALEQYNTYGVDKEPMKSTLVRLISNY